jgi:hypothetical protein
MKVAALALALVCVANVGMSSAAPVKHSRNAASPTAKPDSVIAPVPKFLPVFDFQGEDTETEYQIPLKLSGKSWGSGCNRTGDTILCTNYDHPIVAGRPMRWLSKDYYKNRLYCVQAQFGQGAAKDVLDALLKKYGPPSETEVRKWQSQAGATFENTVAIWKFKGGKLELESIGSEINSGIFTFTSEENSPPKAAAKVDF